MLGIANPTHVLDFERKVKGKRIGVFYEDMGILIENKSLGEEPLRRSASADLLRYSVQMHAILGLALGLT